MKKLSKWKRGAAVVAVAAASVAAWEGGSSLVANVQFARAEAQVQTSREQLQGVEDLSTVFRNVGRAVEPSVVQIEVTKTIKNPHRMMPDDDFFKRFFHQQMPGQNQQMPAPDQDNNGDDDSPNAPNDPGDDQVERGTGSGVIMEVDGSDAYILTNNHVAGGATKMTVTLNDGRIVQNGKTVGADAKSDLAVVKIHADRLIPAKWGDSDQLERGDWVLAFGSPFGYVGSMTHGIVSALNRSQVGIIDQGQGYENFIQVDAPINPGNSGGPLTNIHGEVVGINTAIASRSGAFSGIGFAIPSDDAHRIYSSLKDHGHVVRGWLGVEIRDVQSEPELAKESGYTGATGVLVQEVLQGTPAFGKLQPGDVITALNGKPIENVTHLRNSVALIAPNTDSDFQIFRDGKQQDVNVKLGEQPENMLAMAQGTHASPGDSGGSDQSDSEQTVARMGLELGDVTDELSQKYNLGDAHDGALVIAVRPNSPAALSGIAPGDLITRVNNQKVGNTHDALDLIAKQDLNKGFRLRITNRQGDGIRLMQSGRP